MLDQKRKYYVLTGAHLAHGTIASWASENGMKVGNTMVMLVSGEQAFELETQYNGELRISARTLRRNCPNLMNGERCIGSVKLDRVLSGHEMAVCYAIYPEIRDR